MLYRIVLLCLITAAPVFGQSMKRERSRYAGGAACATYADCGTIHWRAIASDAVGVTNDPPNNGEAVDTVQTTGADAKDLSQLTAANQPNYVTSDANFNNEPSLEMDFNDWMSTGAAFPGGALSQPYTIFGVANVSVTSADKRLFDSQTGGQVWIECENAGPVWDIGASTTQTGGTCSTGTKVFSWVVDGANSVFYVDGASVITANPGTSSINGIVLGVNQATTTNFWGNAATGHIGELILYSGAMPTANRQVVECLLANKYGVTISGC